MYEAISLRDLLTPELHLNADIIEELRALSIPVHAEEEEGRIRIIFGTQRENLRILIIKEMNTALVYHTVNGTVDSYNVYILSEALTTLTLKPTAKKITTTLTNQAGR